MDENTSAMLATVVRQCQSPTSAVRLRFCEGKLRSFYGKLRLEDVAEAASFFVFELALTGYYERR